MGKTIAVDSPEFLKIQCEPELSLKRGMILNAVTSNSICFFSIDEKSSIKIHVARAEAEDDANSADSPVVKAQVGFIGEVIYAVVRVQDETIPKITPEQRWLLLRKWPGLIRMIASVSPEIPFEKIYEVRFISEFGQTIAGV